MTEIPGTVRSHRALTLMVAVVAIVLTWSGTSPYERMTWWLEVAPVLFVVPLLIATASRFPLTPLLYVLIGVHATILMAGGHYTYARVPPGFWVQDLFELSRNHYDRLGHFAQGFVPAIAAREVLLRTSPLAGSRWLPVLVVAMCLAISACYEFLEWWIALIAGVAADTFLATQGDIWDTQWDMFLAMTGAITSLATLSRTHDRALVRLLRT